MENEQSMTLTLSHQRIKLHEYSEKLLVKLQYVNPENELSGLSNINKPNLGDKQYEPSITFRLENNEETNLPYLALIMFVETWTKRYEIKLNLKDEICLITFSLEQNIFDLKRKDPVIIYKGEFRSDVMRLIIDEMMKNEIVKIGPESGKEYLLFSVIRDVYKNFISEKEKE